MMARIGIDLDGVCYDFAASLREYLVWQGARHPYECPNPTRWEFYLDWGLSTAEFLTWCHRGAEAGIVFSHGEPNPGTQEAFHLLRQAGHSLHIITDRSFGKNGASERATRAWLDAYDLKFDSLTFTADKTIVNIDAMVEDKLSNYDALHNAGVEMYLVDRPWNQDRAIPRDRVSGILEFAEAVA